MEPRPTDAALRLYREALLDPNLGKLREQFCRTTAGALENVASWLGGDSFLGGGDVPDASNVGDAQPDSDRHIAFRATAAVIEMASELSSGSISLLDQGKRFASSALIRQLIETEYLLKAFSLDFSNATRWARSTPDDIRRSFSPKSMRVVGGFSNREYWQHCDMGGHPAPSGRPLLRFNFAVAPSEDAFLMASMWGDLAQHLRRVWGTADGLLRAEHARYDRLRRVEHEKVRHAEKSWSAADPLSRPVDFQLLSEIAEPMGDGG